jgi:hypothetical protein
MTLKEFIDGIILYIIKATFGALAVIWICVYVHFYFFAVVISVIGRAIFPEKQWDWVEHHFLEVRKYASKQWDDLWG